MDRAGVNGLVLSLALPALVAADHVDLWAAMWACDCFAIVNNIVAGHDYAVDPLDSDSWRHAVTLPDLAPTHGQEPGPVTVNVTSNSNGSHETKL